MKDKAHYGESAEKMGAVRPEEDWPGCRTPSPEDWENIFNSMTDMVTIHDAGFNIICANEAARRVLRLPSHTSRTLKCFHYYHGTECPPRGCPSCRTFKTGEPSAFETFEPKLNMYVEIRAIPRFDENRNVMGLIHIVRDITQRKESERELERHRYRLEELVEARTAALTLANRELQDALSKIRALKGLIPICAWCKKVRDDQGYWNLLETYIKDHSDADFTHGICPECLVRLKRQDDTQ
ncbi:MAG: PAS domain-containing protein [Nitrospirota bacterium]|jgi:PAS domain-containing protein